MTKGMNNADKTLLLAAARFKSEAISDRFFHFAEIGAVSCRFFQFQTMGANGEHRRFFFTVFIRNCDTVSLKRDAQTDF